MKITDTDRINWLNQRSATIGQRERGTYADGTTWEGSTSWMIDAGAWRRRIDAEIRATATPEKPHA